MWVCAPLLGARGARDMGRSGEIWGDVGLCSATRGPRGPRCGEIWESWVGEDDGF